MKNLGIYVTRWHGKDPKKTWEYGIRNEQQADEFLFFCDKAGVEDIFVYMNEDVATPLDKTYNPLPFILKNTDKRVHAWISLTIGRQVSINIANYYYEKISDVMEDYCEAKSVDIADMGTIHRLEDEEHGRVLRYDPSKEATIHFVTEKISQLLADYPSLYGVHLDKFPQGSDALIEKARSLTQGKYLSATVRLDEDHWKQWDVDEVMPMRINYSKDRLKRINLSGFKRMTLGIFGANLSTTKEELAYLKSIGVTPLIYSYNKFSFDRREKREHLLKVLQDA